MGENTSIEWADHTFNPWIGCTKVSPGCDHCYAETRDKRKLLGPVSHWGPGAPRHRTSRDYWKQPRQWQRAAAKFFAEHGRRQRVFCASQADVFDNEVDPAWRRDLFALIGETPDLDWLLLTKRIGNAADMLPPSHLKSPWPNVWLGATIVSQAEANRDVPKLLATPARLRFVSIEPLLEQVDLEQAWHGENALSSECWGDCAWCKKGYPPLYNCQRGLQEGGHWFDHPTGRSGLDWVIVGGESGPGARPMDPDWARLLRDECEAGGVPFLFKQWGHWAPATEEELSAARASCVAAIDSRCDPRTGTKRVGKNVAGRLLDGRTHDGFPRVAGG